jgi:hypothetical protein
LSQTLIFLSWGDAKFGTVVNLILLLPVTAAALEARPGSYSNRYRAAVREGLARYTEMPLVNDMCLLAPAGKFNLAEIQPLSGAGDRFPSPAWACIAVRGVWQTTHCDGLPHRTPK